MARGLVLVLWLAAGCAQRQSLRVEIPAHVERPARSVVLLFVDGLDPRVMQRMLDRDELPHIARRFVSGGTRVDHAVACLPSITYPNTVSLITGDFPGHHGIVDNQWFDRHKLAFQNYVSASTYHSVNEDFRTATLFEMLSEHFSVNVQCHTRRGVTYTIDNFTENAVDWVLHRYESVDQRGAQRLEDVAQVAAGIGRWPSLLLIYLPGADETAHLHGSEGAWYEQALRNLDTQIGRVCDALEHAGITDRTYFVLVTDHGHVPTPRSRRFSMSKWIRKNRGMSVYSEVPRKKELDVEHRYHDLFARLSGYDAVFMSGASRWTSIHLKGARGWPHKPAAEEVERFISAAPPVHELPAVECVLMREGPGVVRVFSRAGDARIERRVNGGRSYRLTILRGNPLGVSDSSALKAFVEAGWHESRDWLAATAATAHPDFVPQAVELFDSSRCGDVVVFAAEGWSFDSKDSSGHGSCLAADMRIPMFFAGPGIAPGGSIPFARLIDVTPTIIDLLGEGPRLKNFPQRDGVSLRDALLRDSALPASAPSANR